MEIIKTLSNDIQLAYGNGLHLLRNGNSVLSDFNEIGTLVNGLIPVYYKDSNLIKYFDVDCGAEYVLDGFNWASGFHYVGNSLTYMFHNYRTCPINNDLNTPYSFQTESNTVHQYFEGKQDVEIKQIKNRKFDYDKQVFIELPLNKYEYNLNRALANALFVEMKYLRIVGKGKLTSNIDMAANPFKIEGKSVYAPKQLSLSKGTDFYGVVDVRTNAIILECKYKSFNILPNMIEYLEDDGSIQSLHY